MTTEDKIYAIEVLNEVSRTTGSLSVKEVSTARLKDLITSLEVDQKYLAEKIPIKDYCNKDKSAFPLLNQYEGLAGKEIKHQPFPDPVKAPDTAFKDENGKTVRYIGTYATGGNVGDIWTKQTDGTYSNGVRRLKQSDIDSDVRNGYLARIRYKSKQETNKEFSAAFEKHLEDTVKAKRESLGSYYDKKPYVRVQDLKYPADSIYDKLAGMPICHKRTTRV